MPTRDQDLYVDVTVLIRGVIPIMNWRITAHHCPVVIKPGHSAVELANVFLLDPGAEETTAPDGRPALENHVTDRRNSPTGRAPFRAWTFKSAGRTRPMRSESGPVSC